MVLTLVPNTSVTVPEDIFTDKTVLSYQAGSYMFPKTGSSYTADEYFISDIQQVNFSTTVIKSGGTCNQLSNYVLIYEYWCQMMFVSFNSNTMGVISGAGTANPFRAP
jgi:hypothetical protein